jgi:hypothetical protein
MKGHDMKERDMKGHDNLLLRHKRHRLIFFPPLLPAAFLPPLKESKLPGPGFLSLHNM